MPRPLPLVAAIATLALLAAVPGAGAATGSPAAEPAVEVNFHLEASNGLHARIESSDDGTQLEFVRKGRVVTYVVPVEATETGLRAEFADLGLIDVTFEPTETLGTREPRKGCKGEPSTHSRGVYSGTIEFTGERRFVRLDATEVEGRMWVGRESEWRCPQGKAPGARGAGAVEGISPRFVGAREQEPELESAVLGAHVRSCRCSFLALALREANGRGLTYFAAERSESRAGMAISRTTYVRAGRASFVFDHAAGTAKVRPPNPFSGSASFKRRPGRVDLLRGTIRVPLLGAAPLIISGGTISAVALDVYEPR